MRHAARFNLSSAFSTIFGLSELRIAAPALPSPRATTRVSPRFRQLRFGAVCTVIGISKVSPSAEKRAAARPSANVLVAPPFDELRLEPEGSPPPRGARRGARHCGGSPALTDDGENGLRLLRGSPGRSLRRAGVSAHGANAQTRGYACAARRFNQDGFSLSTPMEVRVRRRWPWPSMETKQVRTTPISVHVSC